jgi:hypothetical protein
MTEEAKLVIALQQVNNLVSLLKGNQYENFICGKLISLQIELQRQLSLLTKTNYCNTIKE